MTYQEYCKFQELCDSGDINDYDALCIEELEETRKEIEPYCIHRNSKKKDTLVVEWEDIERIINKRICSLSCHRLCKGED